MSACSLRLSAGLALLLLAAHAAPAQEGPAQAPAPAARPGLACLDAGARYTNGAILKVGDLALICRIDAAGAPIWRRLPAGEETSCLYGDSRYSAGATVTGSGLSHTLICRNGRWERMAPPRPAPGVGLVRPAPQRPDSA